MEIERLKDEIKYLKTQLIVLGQLAQRDVTDEDILERIAELIDLGNQPWATVGEPVSAAREYGAGLLLLSSLIDKTKTGGWIADRSTVFRVQTWRRDYRNVDSVTVVMADSSYNDDEVTVTRARQIAAALNRL